MSVNRDRQRDMRICLAFFALGVVTRAPFTGRILYHWDSVNFALALERFDVAAGQPHVPGYILYVALARIVSLIAGDAQATLVAISVASSGLAVAFLYLLGAAMFGRGAGTIAALLLASSPLFWFYGEIALPHSLDCLAVVVLVWLLYRIQGGEHRLAIPAAVWLGIAGGFRPQTQVFFAPLAIYAAWRLDWKRRLAAVAVLGAVDLAWFTPLMQLSGGMARYFEVMGQFSDAFNSTTSLLRGAGLWGLTRNARKLVMYTAYGMSAAWIPLLLVAPAARRDIRRWISDRRFVFGIIWALPSLAFYLLIHMGQQGLVFVFLPALLLASAVALDTLLSTAAVRSLVVAVLIGTNTALFLLGPTYPLGGDRPKLLTLDTLARHDAYYADRFTLVRQRFAPEHTLLLSSGWRFPQYYLRDYAIVRYAVVARWELGEGAPKLEHERRVSARSEGLRPDADGSLRMVVFDETLDAFNRSASRAEWIELPHGGRIAVMRFGAGEEILLGPGSFEIVPAR